MLCYDGLVYCGLLIVTVWIDFGLFADCCVCDDWVACIGCL